MTISIPTLRDLSDRAEQLREEVEAAVETVGQRAAELLPERGRRQLDEVLQRLGVARKRLTKRVTKARTDLEERIDEIRGTVGKGVSSIREGTEQRSKEALEAIEREARRQVTTLFKRFNLPVKSDIDALKRRLSALERKLDEVAKELQVAA